MALKKWVYFYLSPGFSPELNTTTSHSDQCEFIAVGMDFADKEDVVDQARLWIDRGVQMIELCGGFGPMWIARISKAIASKVPVGSVAYGPEARQPMLDLLAADVPS